MALIKIEDVIDYLDHDMKRALEQAVSNTIPDAYFDRNQLFREIVRAVRRKCSTWESIPDRLVDTN